MFFLTWPAIPELNGYRVSSRSAGKNKSEPLHSVKRQGKKATAERNKNKTATDGDIFAGRRAAAYRRAGSRTWAPGPCGSGLRTPCLGSVVKNERAAERGGINISRVFDRLLFPRISATALRIPVRLCHYFHPSKFYHFLCLEP